MINRTFDFHYGPERSLPMIEYYILKMFNILTHQIDGTWNFCSTLWAIKVTGHTPSFNFKYKKKHLSASSIKIRSRVTKWIKERSTENFKVIQTEIKKDKWLDGFNKT